MRSNKLLCVFQVMRPEKNIWLFLGEGGRFPSSAFNDFDSAEEWIFKHNLTGMLSAMPVDQGLFEWAVENDAFSMKPETLEKKQNDSRFIATCTTASIEHYHYENGQRN